MQIRVIEKRKGFGDKIESTFKSLGVARLIEAAGIKDCGCKERKEMINKAESWVKAKLQFTTARIQKQTLGDSNNKQNTINVLGNRSTDLNWGLNAKNVEYTDEAEKMLVTPKTEEQS